MAQELFIHAGAHRTGTSSFQLLLAENRASLTANGVLPLYPKRDGAPGGRLRLRLPGPNAGPRKVKRAAEALEAEIGRHFGGAGALPQVILSEENIPGRMFHFYAGQFFPAAPRRLDMLSAALTTQGVSRPKRVVYVIRSYAEIFISAYRKRAEDNPVGPFDEIAPRLVDMQRGWPDLLIEMRDRLEPEEMIVLRYEKRGSSQDLLAHVLGQRIPGIDEPTKRVNLSATDAALEVLQNRLHAGETLDRAQWQGLIADYAHLTEPRGFAAFTPAQQAQLEQRYAADCAAVAVLPGITFLE